MAATLPTLPSPLSHFCATARGQRKEKAYPQEERKNMAPGCESGVLYVECLEELVFKLLEKPAGLSRPQNTTTI